MQSSTARLHVLVISKPVNWH